MNDNQNNSNDTGRKLNVFIQILIGFGITTAAYFITGNIAEMFRSMLVTAIIVFVVLTLYCFLIVKFFRKGYTAAAITMLVCIVPQIFSLLIIGTCAIIALPY